VLTLPALVLAVCGVVRLVTGGWRVPAVPIVALACALCAPVNFSITKLHSAPTGLLAIICSFLLLGLGALLALTKHHWHPPESQDVNALRP